MPKSRNKYKATTTRRPSQSSQNRDEDEPGLPHTQSSSNSSLAAVTTAEPPQRTSVTTLEDATTGGPLSPPPLVVVGSGGINDFLDAEVQLSDNEPHTRPGTSATTTGSRMERDRGDDDSDDDDDDDDDGSHTPRRVAADAALMESSTPLLDIPPLASHLQTPDRQSANASPHLLTRQSSSFLRPASPHYSRPHHHPVWQLMTKATAVGSPTGSGGSFSPPAAAAAGTGPSSSAQREAEDSTTFPPQPTRSVGRESSDRDHEQQNERPLGDAMTSSAAAPPTTDVPPALPATVPIASTNEVEQQEEHAPLETYQGGNEEDDDEEELLDEAPQLRDLHSPPLQEEQQGVQDRELEASCVAPPVNCAVLPETEWTSPRRGNHPQYPVLPIAVDSKATLVSDSTTPVMTPIESAVASSTEATPVSAPLQMEKVAGGAVTEPCPLTTPDEEEERRYCSTATNKMLETKEETESHDAAAPQPLPSSSSFLSPSSPQLPRIDSSSMRESTSSPPMRRSSVARERLSTDRERVEVEMRMAASSTGTHFQEGHMLCYCCGAQLPMLIQAKYHLMRCEETLPATMQALSQHPLCGVMQYPAAPSTPFLNTKADWNGTSERAVAYEGGPTQWLWQYNTEALAILQRRVVGCRGCGESFAIVDAATHFRVCPRHGCVRPNFQLRSQPHRTPSEPQILSPTQSRQLMMQTQSNNNNNNSTLMISTMTTDPSPNAVSPLPTKPQEGMQTSPGGGRSLDHRSTPQRAVSAVPVVARQGKYCGCCRRQTLSFEQREDQEIANGIAEIEALKHRTRERRDSEKRAMEESGISVAASVQRCSACGQT